MFTFEKFSKPPNQLNKTRSNLNLTNVTLNNQVNTLTSSRLFNNNIFSPSKRTSFFQKNKSPSKSNVVDFFNTNNRRPSFLSNSKYSGKKESSEVIIQNKLSDFFNYKDQNQKKFNNKFGNLFLNNEQQQYLQKKQLNKDFYSAFSQHTPSKFQNQFQLLNKENQYKKKDNFEQFLYNSNQKSLNDNKIDQFNLNFDNKLKLKSNRNGQKKSFAFTKEYSQQQYQFKPESYSIKQQQLNLQSGLPTQNISRIQGLISISQLQGLEAAINNCSNNEYKTLPQNYLRSLQQLSNAIRSKQNCLY